MTSDQAPGTPLGSTGASGGAHPGGVHANGDPGTAGASGVAGASGASGAAGVSDAAGPAVAVAVSLDVLRHPEAGEHLLTAVERERSARFRREETRTDFLAAHYLVRFVAARLLGVPADRIELAQNCPDCGKGDHGKPYLPDHPGVDVSLSHAKGLVAAAAGYATVGVDVEAAGRGGSDAVVERVMSPEELRLVREHPRPEHAFLRQWVRKESLVKIGRTTLDRLSSVDLSALPLDLPDGGPLLSRHEDLHVLDWEGTDEQPGPLRGAALAAVSTAPPRLVDVLDVLGG